MPRNLLSCFEKFLAICRTAALGCPRRRLESLRYRSFHVLWAGQGPMRGCFEKFLAPRAFRLCMMKVRSVHVSE
jgi:hypothetical protein